jgi:hypothetical protein
MSSSDVAVLNHTVHMAALQACRMLEWAEAIAPLSQNSQLKLQFSNRLLHCCKMGIFATVSKAVTFLRPCSLGGLVKEIVSRYADRESCNLDIVRL